MSRVAQKADAEMVVNRMLGLAEAWRPPDSQLPPPPDIHQELMNRAYQNYGQKAERVRMAKASTKVGNALLGRSYDNGLGTQHSNFLEALSEAERIAVVFGNLNYQIGNGGINQWISNGYYADTYDYLQQYIQRYGEKYPAINDLGNLFEKIHDSASSFGSGEMELEDIVNDSGSFIEKIEMAIQDENWSELDDLVGGSEYDQRNFDNSIESTIREEISVEIEGEDGRFYYIITIFREEVERSEPRFSNEDEAYDAADRRSDEIMGEIIEGGESEEVLDRAKEIVKEQFSQELVGHIERDIQRMFSGLDDEYDKLSPRILEAVGSLLRTEFSVAGDIRNFINQAIGKARNLVKKFRTGASNILARAASKIRPEESQLDSISRILS